MNAPLARLKNKENRWSLASSEDPRGDVEQMFGPSSLRYLRVRKVVS
jgi:hypothetical protein